jgi:sigma-B regulation protein RsbU (phosphoserine phosphatase)
MKISNSKIGLAIGDICGKGIPAALLSSTVQAAIRSQIEFTTSSGEIITNLNRLLIKSTAESIFLTIFFGILDLSSSVLRYVNAGHPPPVIVSKGHPLNELSATSPPLGIVDSGKLQESEAFMMPGDTLILYTDGIIESRDRNKAIFGRQRLLRTLEEIALHPKKTPPLGSIVAGIKQELKRFIQSTDQSDDLTLLAIRRKQTNHVATETK